MCSQIFKIPAKGMLFGEYGVLINYPALAITFYNYFFEIQIDIEIKKENENNILIQSDFFQNGELSFNLTENSEKKSEFFYKLLYSWKEELKNYTLKIKILKSFPPNLGFGSSSAILAAVTLALFKKFYSNKNPLNPRLKSGELKNKIFWEKCRQSIIQIQNKGSGYDVGVQVAACLEKSLEPKLWIYKNNKNSVCPIIKNISIPLNLLKHFGCFVHTHQYSNTSQILNKEKKFEKYGKKHGELAKKFIQDILNINSNHEAFVLKLSESMHASLKIAREQGILPSQLAIQNKVPFKTMGAGHGDCLWVHCTKAQLLANGLKVTDIALNFEEIMNIFSPIEPPHIELIG